MHSGRAAQVTWLFGLMLLVMGGLSSVARGEALFVRGAVSGTWEAPVDTVVIDSFAWVPQAETLIVAPGMVIAFSGRFSLIVNGTLLAEKLGKDSIRVQSRPYHASAGHLGIRFRNTSTLSKLSGILFEDGFANIGDPERYGGAIELYFAEVEIDSCVFKGNRARIDGGAIYCREAANLTVRDCDFIGDSTRFGAGGAILARTSGSVTLQRCNFVGNKAVTSGGAVVMESGVTPTIEECYFRENIALVRGGAVQLRSSPVAGVMRNCVIEICKADQGGGVYLDNSRATVEACSVQFCEARLGAGFAARGNNNTSPISRAVIEENLGTEEGGGLYLVENARCIIQNSVIRDNEAARGGGVFSASGTAPVIRFSTIIENRAAQGSAIQFDGAGSMSSTIVSGETGLIHFGSVASTRISFSNVYSESGDELTGNAPGWLLSETRLNVALVQCDSLRNISREPQFSDVANGDFCLLDHSPCLFAADTSGASGIDFSGNSRVLPAHSWPDMGAFESDALLPFDQHCGSQSGIWYPGDYVIGCSLRVQQHDTLIIMGGTKLLFAPGANLFVEGTVLALGTARDSIVLDRYLELPRATWGGVTLSALSHGSRFDYCAVRRVTNGPAVSLLSRNTEFNHCTFSSNENGRDEGGAVVAWESPEATFSDCRFQWNRAAIGGAVAVFNGDIQFTRCEFRSNEVRNPAEERNGYGGAVFTTLPVGISDCIFRDNFAYAGGALYGVLSQIERCTFDSCRATLGGAIAISGGIPEFNDSEFRGNSAKERGGAVIAVGVDVLDVNCTYTNNRSLFGGAIAVQEGTYTSDSTAFIDNIADRDGGALWLVDNAFALTRACEFYRNSAANGGVVFADSSAFDAEFCLLDSNVASQSGGGIFLQNGGLIVRKSTLVKQQSLNQGSAIHARGNSAISVNSSVIAESWNNSLSLGPDVLHDIEFSLFDVPIVHAGDSVGWPLTVNFNGDSCDRHFNLIASPQFANSAQRDYSLLSHSKAVHAADSLLEFDSDGTRSDIGLFSGTRPYSLPHPFNLTFPERNAAFHPQDQIQFEWNEARDDDPGDVVDYVFHLHGTDFDTTVLTNHIRSLSLSLLNGEYQWWVEAISLRPDIPRESFERRSFVVADPVMNVRSTQLPHEFSVQLAGPNPFNSSTTIQLALPRSAAVQLTMHDVLGREAFRNESSLSAGTHTIRVDAANLGSGVYWLTVTAGDEVGRLKVLLLK